MLTKDNATDPFMKAALELGEREGLGFQIKQKSESRLMWLIGRFARLFNKRWMDRYHTTMGSTIYLTTTPEQTMQMQRRLVETVLHEMTHVYDRKKHGVRFTIGYAMPQMLAVLALPLLLISVLLVLVAPTRSTAWVGLLVGLIASVALSVWLCPWLLLTAVSLLALAPWPSPWRVRWERRGYQMSMAVSYWMRGQIVHTPSWFVEQFVGWAYYRMSWDRKGMLKTLREDAEDVVEGLVEKDPWFARTHAAMIEAKRGVVE